MTLAEVIKIVERVASAQPDINMVVRNDVFRINAAPSVKYGVFAWLQNQHRLEVENDYMHFSFTFFYVDRLTEDGSNEIEVQSTGITTLGNILKRLDDLGVLTEDDYTFQTFNQRFLDVCAGVFCNVDLVVPVAVCAEDFPDIADGINDDILVY